MKERVEIEKGLRVNLHPKQQEAFDAAKKGKNIFITGQGGVGKSMILKKIIQHFEEKDRVSIGVVAPTGIAATALPNGETIHSFSGVGIPSIKSDFGKTWQKKILWRSLNVLVIDEISMLSGEFLDYLSQEICKIRESSLPFGGIQLIFCGDSCNYHQSKGQSKISSIWNQ
jgi:ATP-dependent DNA helicase PIF1